MRFHIPQFIEVEDKIFGPLTFKQFVYLCGGAGGGYLLYRILPKFMGAPLALALFGLGVALAFYKPNNRPFSSMLEAGLRFVISSKLYIWKKVPTKESSGSYIPRTSSAEKGLGKLPSVGETNRLSGMAWNLDVRDPMKDGGGGDE